ncbi:uncharacterized protein V6R79_009446 [Siganus canaliculatus]
MESSIEAVAAEPPAPAFSQVVFVNIPHSYPPATNITCCYTLTPALQPTPRDWVGIFKVGWSTTKDYHTFVWVEPSTDVEGQQSGTREVVFREYYLPKDELDFYQFCYVDSAGQVRGASTPFCFRIAAGQSLESHLVDDLVVITTQEQVDQSVRERAELQRELDQKARENESLKEALQQEQLGADILKEQNEEKEKENLKLVKELEEMKEDKKKLESSLQQQQRESDDLKEAVAQMTQQLEIQEKNAAEQKKQSQSVSAQNEADVQRKYDQAVMKINQLKAERNDLRDKMEAQSEEVKRFKSKTTEQERELFNLRGHVQLLEVDLQTSENDKERISSDLQKLQSIAHDMDAVKRENQELLRRLEQEAPASSSADNLRVQYQNLSSQLQDAQAKLADEKELSRCSRARVEYLEGEKRQNMEALEKLNSSVEKLQNHNNKQEMLLREAHAAIADKDVILQDKERQITVVKRENEGLAGENQDLRGNIEELRRAYAELQAAPPADARPHLTTTSPGPYEQQPEAPGQVENLYEAIGDPGAVEETLVCRFCQELFPGITQQELLQHESSHRLCPICSTVCDAMQQHEFEDHVYSHEL